MELIKNIRQSKSSALKETYSTNAYLRTEEISKTNNQNFFFGK